MRAGFGPTWTVLDIMRGVFWGPRTVLGIMRPGFGEHLNSTGYDVSWFSGSDDHFTSPVLEVLGHCFMSLFTSAGSCVALLARCLCTFTAVTLCLWGTTRHSRHSCRRSEFCVVIVWNLVTEQPRCSPWIVCSLLMSYCYFFFILDLKFISFPLLRSAKLVLKLIFVNFQWLWIMNCFC